MPQGMGRVQEHRRSTLTVEIADIALLLVDPINSRIVGKPSLIGLWKGCSSFGHNALQLLRTGLLAHLCEDG